MIVELIGCTGAGKTSIARRLVALSQPAGDIALMPDLLLQAAHLGRVRNAQVVNVVQDVAGLPFLVSSWSDHRALIRLSWRLLHQHGGSAIGQALDLRSVLRRTGMYAMAHRRQWAPIVLFDEGPLLVAYHIYGYTSAPFGERGARGVRSPGSDP